MPSPDGTLRIGALGAARITPAALIKPAAAIDGVEVTAVAARDRAAGAAFAAEHGVPVVHDSYQALIEDPDLDAVYVPLPNGLHGRWTLAAIAAGKHVLCEKPFTANAAEARRVADAATASGLVVAEAFHYRYHPLMSRVLALLAEGALGRVHEIRTSMCFPLPRFSDIRYRLDLAGGALMDAGCYAVHCLRTLAAAAAPGAVPAALGTPEVLTAVATEHSPGVDRAMTATLRCPGGITGRVVTSMWSRHMLGLSASVRGERGELVVRNYAAPHLWHRLSVRTREAGGRPHRHAERVPGEPTYTHQLRAFAAAVVGDEPLLTPARDAVATMSVIDDIYRAAGLAPREPTPAG